MVNLAILRDTNYKYNSPFMTQQNERLKWDNNQTCNGPYMGCY